MIFFSRGSNFQLFVAEGERVTGNRKNRSTTQTAHFIEILFQHCQLSIYIVLNYDGTRLFMLLRSFICTDYIYSHFVSLAR